MKKIDFFFFDAGGGHRSAATALKLVIEQQQRPWDVRLVNLQEVLAPIDVFRKYLRISMEDVYNLLLKKGWTLGSPQLTVAMHAVIRLYHPLQKRFLRDHWRKERPDLVVSLIPNFNRALFESLNEVHPGVPFINIITDLADYPPHFWMERQHQYVVCGTEKAVEQARALGYSDDRIFQTSGMIVHPRFYAPVTVDRETERRRLGLDSGKPTGLVLFGGQGSRVMLEISERLDRFQGDLQLIFICGRNEKLREKLTRRTSRLPRFVEGFTLEVPYYMALSDFFIGKPGPGSISEAILMNLPVIVESNAWTLPQERYNAEWVLEKGVGLVLRNFREIEPAVRRLLSPEHFQTYKANAAAINNRAVFEIPDILEKLL